MSISYNMSCESVKVNIVREKEDYNHLLIKVRGKGFLGEETDMLIIVSAKNMEVRNDDWQSPATDVPVFDVGAHQGVASAISETKENSGQDSEVDQ